MTVAMPLSVVNAPGACDKISNADCHGARGQGLTTLPL